VSHLLLCLLHVLDGCLHLLVAGLHYLAELSVLWFLAPDLQSMLPSASLHINAPQIVGLECRARSATGSDAGKL